MNVNKFIRPQSGSYSQDGGTTVSSNCKTDGNGRLRAFFELPNNSIDRFPTGQRELRITSSFYNLSNLLQMVVQYIKHKVYYNLHKLKLYQQEMVE